MNKLEPIPEPFAEFTAYSLVVEIARQINILTGKNMIVMTDPEGRLIVQLNDPD